MSLTPAQRTLRARIAAHAMHARNDSRVTTEPARRAWLARFELEVDPDGVLDAEERHRRAAHARSAYYSRLALARSKRGSLTKPENEEKEMLLQIVR